MAKESSALAKAYTNIQIFHDGKDYGRMEHEMKKYLKILKIEKNKISASSGIMRKMYVLSDRADEFLKEGNKGKHDKIFRRIFLLSKSMDEILDLKKGSFSDEVRWWLSFRLARSEYNHRKPGKMKKYLNMFLAFIFVFAEHFKRLEKRRFAFPCAIFLAKAGMSHAKDDWKSTEKYMIKYWDSRIKGNNNRIDASLLEI